MAEADLENVTTGCYPSRFDLPCKRILRLFKGNVYVVPQCSWLWLIKCNLFSAFLKQNEFLGNSKIENKI